MQVLAVRASLLLLLLLLDHAGVWRAEPTIPPRHRFTSSYQLRGFQGRSLRGEDAGVGGADFTIGARVGFLENAGIGSTDPAGSWLSSRLLLDALSRGAVPALLLLLLLLLPLGLQDTRLGGAHLAV